MAVTILILILILIVGLNVIFGKRLRMTKEPKPKIKATTPEEEFAEPVARKYTVLYWYSGLGIAVDAVVLFWTLIFTQPWKRYTAQYVAKHDPHQTVQYLQLQDKVVLLAFAAFLIGVYIALVKSKRMKDITTILKIFLGWDVLGFIVNITKPTSVYELIHGIFAVAFTALVLWSLIKREPNFFKIFKFKQELKG